MNQSEPSRPTRRRNAYAFMACETCRAAKLKCSAHIPCTRCHRLNKPCVYRRLMRRRRGVFPSPNVPGDGLDSACRGDDFRPEQRLPPACGRFGRPDTAPATLNETTDTAVYRFLRNIFTGPEPSRTLSPSTFQAFTSPSPWELLPFTTASNPDLQYLPTDLTTRCFGIYVASLWHLNPFQPIVLLQASLCDVLGAVGSIHSSTPIDRANALAVLAVGASCTEYHAFAAYLHQKSTQYADETVVDHDPSMAVYQTHINQHATAYAMLDDARAHLALLGLESSGTRTAPHSPTLVTLIGFERYIALCMGRPSNFPDDLCPPDDHLPPALLAVSKFSLVASQITRAQQELRGDLNALTQASYELHQRLNIFLLEASHRCRSLYINEQQRVEVEILICVLFHYGIQILFRPFLIAKIKSLQLSNAPSPSAPSQTSGCTPSLTDLAAPYAVRAARSMISLIGQAFYSGSVVKDLPPNASFIESACLSLLLAALGENLHRSSASLAQYLGDICRGLGYMGQMSCQATVASRVQRVEALLAVSGFEGVGLGSGGHSSYMHVVPGVQNQPVLDELLAGY
ncbi:hypothetical protein BDW74DRAFT_177998 [Aspergillus multicolor]|uniref:Zn(II)2Cys6 transcription factor n=1 Tax=Aspergillus multicolor TaxID=41759 RepID=UPI003CCD674E